MKQKTAFTLIELSIVIIIIGLIIGSILIGRDLIKSAEMRAVVNELSNYHAAYNTFRLKYNCIPGDCASATSFISGATNGDGDGMICSTADIINTCSYQFWYHLAESKIISGTYTGSGSNYRPVIGTNIPASVIGNGVGVGAFGGTTGWGIRGNFIRLASLTPSDGGYYGGANSTKFYGPALTSVDAFNLDTKMDDGKPYSGRIITGDDYSSIAPYAPCQSANIWGSAPYSGSYYKTADDRPKCSVIYKLD